MDLKQLRHFIAIVESGSLSRAASLVRIAQPALSHQLAQLEAELGIRLVERTRQGVTPTLAGERLYRHARGILRQVEDAKADVLSSARDVSGTVSVGLPTSTAMLLALPLLNSVREVYPGVRLQLFESFGGYLSELLLKNRLDLAILMQDGPRKGVDSAPLLTESLYLVSRLGPDEEPPPATVDMRTMAGRPVVLPSRRDSSLRALIDRGFAQIGVELDVIADVDSLSTMREAAKEGVADTILPMCALGPLRDTPETHAIRRLTHPGIRRSLSLCRPEDMPVTPAVAAVTDRLVSEIMRLLPTGMWGDATLTHADAPDSPCSPRRQERCKAERGWCPMDEDKGAQPKLASVVRRGRCAACN